MSQFCCDCTSWEKILQPVSGDTFGICHNVGVAMKVALDGKTHLGENGTLWTNGYFGCIYYRDRKDEVISFDDVFDEDIEDGDDEDEDL